MRNIWMRLKVISSHITNLLEFIRIPSLSPIFDEDWAQNRNLFKAMDHMIAFANKVGIKGATIKPKEEPGRSPFLIVDVAA